MRTCNNLQCLFLILCLFISQSLLAQRARVRSTPRVSTRVTPPAVKPTPSATTAQAGKRMADAVKKSSVGRSGRQARLNELKDHPNTQPAHRASLRQEAKAVERGNRKTLRMPPGTELAHPRGMEAAKGYDHRNSIIQNKDLHRLQHKYDRNGQLQRERPRVVAP